MILQSGQQFSGCASEKLFQKVAKDDFFKWTEKLCRLFYWYLIIFTRDFLCRVPYLGLNWYSIGHEEEVFSRQQGMKLPMIMKNKRLFFHPQKPYKAIYLSWKGDHISHLLTSCKWVFLVTLSSTGFFVPWFHWCNNYLGVFCILKCVSFKQLLGDLCKQKLAVLWLAVLSMPTKPVYCVTLIL